MGEEEEEEEEEEVEEKARCGSNSQSHVSLTSSTFLWKKSRFPRDATLHNNHIMSFFQTIILLEFHKKK